MKPGEEDTKAHEVVLIRRRHGGEEGGHHGGVWKIAYADFMTAMMAFFLVMWLINSTDQRVITQVANYFNPTRLTDSTPLTRGVHNVESGEQGKQSSGADSNEKAEKSKAKSKAKGDEGKAEGTGESKTGDTQDDAKTTAPAKEGKSAPGKAKYTEQALFSDPYGVLARIATEAASDGSPPAAANKDATAVDDVFRDPFDPGRQHAADKRSTAPRATSPSEAKELASAPEAKAPQGTEMSPAVARGPEAGQTEPAGGGEAKAPRDNASAPKELSLPVESTQERAAQEALKAARQAAARDAAHKARTQDEAARIEGEITRVMSQLPGLLPNFDVTITEDGVLITLTDDYDFGMFAIGSAEPRPATVVIMEKMAKILQQHPQPLIVRGHTDGRPYRSGIYDNWRLSTARAHMAYYMLVRGGIAERRFERVEGHADRSLRVPGDPDAAQNRRIEILLRRPKQ